MTNNQYLSLESIYIIDISIYLDLPARGTDRQIYRLSVERTISIYKAVDPPPSLGEETDRIGTDRQTGRQTDGQFKD